MSVSYDMWFKNNSLLLLAGGTLDLFRSVFKVMDAIPCQLDMASADLLQLKLELDSCRKVEGEQGCCSQDPHWIINATSSTVMDFDLDQEFTNTKKKTTDN